MKKTLAIVSFLFFFSMVSAGTLTYSTDAVSRYIWRGLDLGTVVDYKDDGHSFPNKYLANNTPAIQPGLTYTLDNGLSIGLWGSIGAGPNSSKELDELDLTAAYAFSANSIDYKIGYTHYTFPSQAQYYERIAGMTKTDAVDYIDSDEVFIGGTLSKIFLSPSLTIYNDYDRNKFNSAADPLQNGDDRSRYTYTELGLSFPTLPYGLTNSLTLGFDGTYGSNGSLTNANYKVAKDLSSGFTGYTNLILLTGAKAGGGSTPVNATDEAGNLSTDTEGKTSWEPKNFNNYEIVFGVNYTGSASL